MAVKYVHDMLLYINVSKWSQNIWIWDGVYSTKWLHSGSTTVRKNLSATIISSLSDEWKFPISTVHCS